MNVAAISFVSYISIMSRGTIKPKTEENQFPEEVRNQSTEALKRLRDTDLNQPVNVYVTGSEQAPITLPPVILKLLADVLARVSANQPVSILTQDTVFTTQQAADRLNVSRPYVVKLIENGDLAADKVGRHRRIKASNLEEYRRRQQTETRNASREMARLTADWEADD